MNVGIYREGGVSPGLPLPRKWLGGLTITIGALALVVMFVSPALLAIGRSSGGAWRTIQQAGFIGAGPVLCLDIGGPIALAVLGAMVVRDRLSAALLLAPAALPIALGLIGHAAGLRITFTAIGGDALDPEQQLRIMTEGAAEAMCNDIVSGFVACGCAIVACAAAASVAASIDVASALRGASTRKAGLVATSVVGGLWLVASIVLAAVRMGSEGVLVVVPVIAVAAIVPFAILAGRGVAGLKASSDPGESRRVLDGVVVAGACAAIALVGLERAIQATSLSRALEAIAGESLDPSQQARILVAAVVDRRAGSIAMGLHAFLGASTFLVAVVATFGRHRRPSWVSLVAALAIPCMLALGASSVVRSRTTKVRAIAQTEIDAAGGVTLPTLTRGSSRHGSEPSSAATSFVLRADGSVGTGATTPCTTASASVTLHADRAATARMLSDLLERHGCLDAPLVFVGRRERAAGIDEQLGDLAVFLGHDAYVDAARPQRGTAKEPVVLVRIISDDAIDVDGVRVPYPLPPGTVLTVARPFDMLRFVFQPSDSIERIVRTLSSVRDALGDPEVAGVFLDLGVRLPPRLDPGLADSLGTIGLAAAGRSKLVVRQGSVEVHGGLPTEVVQRVVRQNFGRMRVCYENRADPASAGRVTVRFVIDRTGAVSAAAEDGSTLPEPKVVTCVVRVFASIVFPQPESGIVTVAYPMIFAPSS